MDPVNCRGIILGSREYKEKDRLVSVLTPEMGLITVCAKGTAKPGSRNAFASVPFMIVDLVLTTSHGYYYLKDGSVVENNSGIMNNLEAMTVASHISECLKDSTYDAADARQAYELAICAFYVLSRSPEQYLTVYSAFNWRLLTIAGFTILYDLNEPAYKATGNKPARYMINISGTEGNQTKTFNRLLDAPSVRALNYFATCDLKRMFTSSADKKTEEELKDFTTDYLSMHFEKNYDALSILKI